MRTSENFTPPSTQITRLQTFTKMSSPAHHADQQNLLDETLTQERFARIDRQDAIEGNRSVVQRDPEEEELMQRRLTFLQGITGPSSTDEVYIDWRNITAQECRSIAATARKVGGPRPDSGVSWSWLFVLF